jgi:hypothetical protein
MCWGAGSHRRRRADTNVRADANSSAIGKHRNRTLRHVPRQHTAKAGLESDRKSEIMETTVVRSIKLFGAFMQKAGPYLLLEILLPGGTLFALLLLLYRRRQQQGAEMPRVIFVVARLFGRASARIVYVARLYGLASVWRGRERERDGLEALAIGHVH